MVFNQEEMVLNRKHDYKWGIYRYGVDANVVGGVVEYLERQNGKVTSADFLEAARDQSSPVHDMLEWDDKIAAEKHRLKQCTQIICSLKVVVKSDNSKDKEPLVVSAYVDTQKNIGSKTSEFVNIKNALTDSESRSNILSRMYREMVSFSQRYALYSEAAEVIQAINKTLENRDDIN